MQKRAKLARLVVAITAGTILLAFSVGGSRVDDVGYAGSSRSEKSDAGLVKRPREMDAKLVSAECTAEALPRHAQEDFVI
jgi:hypothetical protein